MRGLLKNIMVLFAGVLGTWGNTYAANYSTKSSTNPGYKFEESASWTGGTLPGTYSSSTFTVSSNSNITVNGLVYLNGNLDMKNESTIKVSDNSTLIISGNFDISDKSKITIGNSASVYVKGNFTTYDLVPPEYSFLYYNSNDRLYIEMDKYSNLAVEGNFTSTSGAQVTFISPRNGGPGGGASGGWGGGNAPDFYVFGDWSGTAYTAISNLTEVEDEESFERNESALNNTVVKATANLDNCAMTIPANTSYVVGVDEEIYVTALTMNANSTLVNNGKIHFVKSCADHTLADFDFASTCFNSGVTLVNNGTIDCKNYNQEINQNTYLSKNINIYNHGLFNCTEDFKATYGQCVKFTSSCGSSITADGINFKCYGNDNLSLNGVYTANSMDISMNDGGNTVNFGSDCGSSEVSVNSLTLRNNVSSVNITELTGVNSLSLNTYSSSQFNVTDGKLILGNIANSDKLRISGNANSITILCYNPKNGPNTQDFKKNGGESTTSGKVVYIQHASNSHSWVNNSDFLSEDDVTCNECSLYGYSVPFDECMLGDVASLLPIELVSFSFDKSRNEFVWTTASETNNDYFVVEYSKNGKAWVECTEHVPSQSDNGYTYDTEPIMPINESLFSYFRLKQVDLNGEFSYSDVITISFTVENPCSEEYEDSKMQIREFGNRYYRLINGELIYCENDNE